MRNINVQYMITYGIQGCVFPYAPILFKQRGLDETQIGYALGLSSFCVLFTPGLLSALADAHIDPRKLMAGAYTAAAMALVAVFYSYSAVGLVALWVVFSLASMPIIPLQDGVFFATQRRRESAGLMPQPYHKVRVWGTVGFILPTLVLFPLIDHGLSVAVTALAGAVVCAVGAMQALTLDDPRVGTPPAAAVDRVPTLAALRALREPHLLVFMTASSLLWMAMAGYMPFLQVYANEVVGVEKKWIGPIFNVGVVVEIFFVLAAGRLVRRLGLRVLLLIGVPLITLRIGLTAAFATVPILVGTQLIHGIQAVVMQVVPPAFLNRHADDRYRHSMQGLYLMISGTTRGLGVMLLGPVAKWDLQGAFALSAGLCVAAGLLVLFAFRDGPAPRRDG
jgi:MFS transporter, PPP family, 3-phenylpropionic acid transporter